VPTKRHSVASAAAPKKSEASGVGPTLEEANEELRLGLSELYLRTQRREFETRLQYSGEVQQAEFDQRKADGDAHWALLESLREAAGSEDYASIAFDRGHEHERATQERSAATQERVDEATKRYEEEMRATQEEFAQAFSELHRGQVTRLKAVWASLEPDSVDPGELAALAHFTSVVASSLPPVPPLGVDEPAHAAG